MRSVQSEKRHRRKERKRLVRCLRHSNIDTKQTAQKYEMTNRKEIHKVNQITDMLESIRNNPQLIAIIREVCNKKCDELIGDRPAELLKESLLWEYEPPYEKEYPCTLLIMKDGEYSIAKVTNEEEFKQLDYTRWCNVEDIY